MTQETEKPPLSPDLREAVEDYLIAFQKVFSFLTMTPLEEAKQRLGELSEHNRTVTLEVERPTMSVIITKKAQVQAPANLLQSQFSIPVYISRMTFHENSVLATLKTNQNSKPPSYIHIPSKIEEGKSHGNEPIFWLGDKPKLCLDPFVGPRTPLTKEVIDGLSLWIAKDWSYNHVKLQIIDDFRPF